LVGSALSKISISLLLLRLLGNAAGNIQRYFLYSLNVFVGIYTVIDIVSDVTMYKPLEKSWNAELPGTYRSLSSSLDSVYFQEDSYHYVSAKSRILVKGRQLVRYLLFLFFLSCPYYSSEFLQLNRRTKIVICSLISLGVL